MLNVLMLKVIMLSVVLLRALIIKVIKRCAECRYTECRRAQCRGACIATFSKLEKDYIIVPSNRLVHYFKQTNIYSEQNSPF